MNVKQYQKFKLDIGIWDFFVFWCFRVLVAGLLLSMEEFLHSTFVNQHLSFI